MLRLVIGNGSLILSRVVSHKSDRRDPLKFHMKSLNLGSQNMSQRVTKTPPASRSRTSLTAEISVKPATPTSIVLTAEQTRVIRSSRRYRQIVAAAGAAKTTVLIKIAERLIDEGAEPESILFLTALNSAKDVLRSAVRPDIDCLTFHALGLSLLAHSGAVAEVRHSTEPLSVEGQLQFLRSALKDEARRQKEDSPKASKFLRELREDAKKVRKLLQFIEWVRARGPKAAAEAQETLSNVSSDSVAERTRHFRLV